MWMVACTWVKILKFFDADPGSGMETVRIRDGKKSDPGYNIPNPQHTGEWSAVPERRGCLACRCCCARIRSEAARGWWASRWGWDPRGEGTTAPQPRSTAAAAASTAHSDLRVTKKGLRLTFQKLLRKCGKRLQTLSIAVEVPNRQITSCLDSSLGRVPAGDPGSIPGGGKLNTYGHRQ